MRFLHLADLHPGKTIYGVSLLEAGDQAFWADRLIERVEALRPDAVVVAGDIYDRGAPPGEAVQLLSRMLTALAGMGVPVMLTAGNHDSAQRLAFAGPLLARQGLHISSPLSQGPTLEHVTLQDQWGPVTFWLMPYVYPALATQALGAEGIGDYDAAVRALIARQGVDFSERNVIVAHQNVAANGVEAARGGSETMVGGVGQVDYTAFDGFDYVALGHIHSAYSVGRPEVRYAGSPLCYHFDELRQRAKGPVLVELGEKGAPVRTETIALEPLHPMRQLRGPYEAIRDEALRDARTGEYLRVVLTDQRVSPEAAGFLRELFSARGSVLMELCSEYIPFGGDMAAPEGGAARERPVEALFADFYAARCGGETPDDRDLELMAYAGERLRHADPHGAPEPGDVDGLIDLLMRQEGAR